MTDDVNEQVRAEWREETTPFERVLAVMKRTYEPQSADETATRALTTPTTARKHLQQLADSGVVKPTAEPGRDATLYRRSKESLILEQARDILDEMDAETLATRIGEIQSQINEYRAEFGVDSPEEAAVRGVDIDQQTLREWQTTRRNLGIARAALAVSEAEETYYATAGS